MIERLLDQMRRLDIAVESIERVTAIGEKHVGAGLFHQNYRVQFSDGRAQVWYSRLGRAHRNTEAL